MDYFFVNFFNEFSYSTLIFGLVSAVICLIVRAIFKDKLCTFLKNYLPLLTAFFLVILYDIIFVTKAFSISKNALYMGITSGSLSTIIVAIIKKFNKGEKIMANTLVLLVESMIENYVNTTQCLKLLTQ